MNLFGFEGVLARIGKIAEPLPWIVAVPGVAAVWRVNSRIFPADGGSQPAIRKDLLRFRFQPSLLLAQLVFKSSMPCQEQGEQSRRSHALVLTAAAGCLEFN